MRLVVCSVGIKRKETKNVRKKDGLKGSISNLLEIVIVFLFFFANWMSSVVILILCVVE